jgi:predicted amidohydrolase
MKTSKPIKAGFLQFEPIIGNVCENMNQISRLLNDVGETDLVVLPELANSGYNFESKEEALSLAENERTSIFLDFLISEAKKHQSYIVSGFNERENDTLYNSSILIGNEGLLSKYRKMHLFMNEFDIFEKGNLGLPVFDCGNFKIGMLICFDWVFPEVWRILALKGADIICHPSNLVLPYAQQAVPVHGLINRTFNITANRIGTERGLAFTGGSILSDPLGNTMIKAPSDKECLMIAQLDLDLARNKMITPRNHVFDDRLPAEYGYLVSQTN